MQVALNRYDLFHAHFFLTGDGSIGLLFHAKEFPALSTEFPYNLGFCQRNSTMPYSPLEMAWRNFVWFEVRCTDVQQAVLVQLV